MASVLTNGATELVNGWQVEGSTLGLEVTSFNDIVSEKEQEVIPMRATVKTGRTRCLLACVCLCHFVGLSVNMFDCTSECLFDSLSVRVLIYISVRLSLKRTDGQIRRLIYEEIHYLYIFFH